MGDVTVLRVGDVVLGGDVVNGAKRTGVVVEVVAADGDRPRYVVENRKGQRWTVVWPAV